MQAGPKHVLVVDDKPQMCAVIRERLSSCGFDCRASTESRQAKDLLSSQVFELLITDISMPDISGLDLLAHAKREAPGCKVILITGHSDREYLAQALMLGAYDYVEKPFSADELVQLTYKALSGETDISPLPARAAASMQLSAQAKEASLDSVRAFVRAVEAKDPYTRRHSEQVTRYAVNLAGALHLADRAVESIRVASLLHDIGKIGVPDHILTKSGPLTNEEFGYIRRHPALGAEILANITLFCREAHLVRHHHERWDGTGYPDGLTGEETPLGARVIGVADSMDAMLMERTYKKGYPVEKMLGELERCAGTQFDPTIAAAAVQWCRMNPDKVIVPNRHIEALAGVPA